MKVSPGTIQALDRPKLSKIKRNQNTDIIKCQKCGKNIQNYNNLAFRNLCVKYKRKKKKNVKTQSRISFKKRKNINCFAKCEVIYWQCGYFTFT